MPRFEFRLKALLAARQATRDARRLHLAEAQAAEAAVIAQQAAVETELRRQQESLRAETAPGSLDVTGLVAASRYESALRGELRVLGDRVQQLTAATGDCREALMAADRDVRILEKLRERQHGEFALQQARAESKELDELGARAARQSR